MLTKVLEYKIVHDFSLTLLQLRAIVGVGLMVAVMVKIYTNDVI